MCGIAGYLDLRGTRRPEKKTLVKMAQRMLHRGPDSDGYFIDSQVGFAFRRLSIIDLESGDQPLFNEDRSLALMCNGEIFNHQELRKELLAGGHQFYTKSDVEVLVHLYEEYGAEMVHKLNGQFGFAIWDAKRKTLFLARDHLGIIPLYYTVVDGFFIFGSEIKAILEHPRVHRRVDLTGLDQIFSFPGLVSPRTMFEGISRLENAHYLMIAEGHVTKKQYWDLDYPREAEVRYEEPEDFYSERLRELFTYSVDRRLQADVPVGFYLSGGLDSSLIAAIISELAPDVRRHAFAISFESKMADEAKYQQLMANHVGCQLHQTRFDWTRASELMAKMIYHAECPVRETYNTCSLDLSQAARDTTIKVILSGEGADELFAGYVGYRFDQFRARNQKAATDDPMERRLREELWGDPDLFYEHDYHRLAETKKALYSTSLRDRFPEFDCLKHPLVNKERLAGRHRVHQRSYLDYKLRMVDHLLMDHGDQMGLANSVEVRYPFLDIDIVEFVKQVPPHLKLNGFTEKYILRKIGESLLPKRILKREKFGWFAPGSPELLQQGVDWIHELLSHDRIQRQGYFDAEGIEQLKGRYGKPGFKLNMPFESDLLIVVASFGVFLDVFEMPDLD